ncbi:MAG: hypothetical protein A2136_07080 [Chloroflexi bacterium RBG_16_54_11]|nr:MAG: hypothetical protein A2136_07080 [Chloroflexi bacterium RBG_16_54_11]
MRWIKTEGHTVQVLADVINASPGRVGVDLRRSTEEDIESTRVIAAKRVRSGRGTKVHPAFKDKTIAVLGAEKTAIDRRISAPVSENAFIHADQRVIWETRRTDRPDLGGILPVEDGVKACVSVVLIVVINEICGSKSPRRARAGAGDNTDLDRHRASRQKI